ncbi:HTTM domain-containing protein [Streptomyces sp. NRRL F-5140]|uniref:HTTM domain-containing protein n=1 Tax=Streptomyces TaxID=1883 RepID=UPI0007C6BD0C|nr:Vitamin K-dependent gamma-carboxylase [Streptomyces sp. KS_5]SEC89264.1 Vitamin K-dependent gamma-carboxylase [Streptomyces sp. PAN_FS17]
MHLLQRALDRIHAFLVFLTERPVSLYAAAMLRIGYGLLYLVFLLREFPHREEMWGPGSPWTPELARLMYDQSGWASVLLLSDSQAYFEVCYAVALITCALFVLGWRTRAVSVLFAAVVVSFHGRAIYMADGGDNLMVLMAVYLVFTACGRRWSLDARRARCKAATGKVADPRGSGLRHQLGDARSILTTVLHNCGMFVIAAQVCFLYGCAGLYKVQGYKWADGTALHYILNIDLFRPWPELSQMIDGYHVLLTGVGYMTVLVQVAFPFVLFSRLKYPVLILLLGMHVNIAVLMGLPLFSGAMIVADAVFLPDRFYRAAGRLWRRTVRRTGVTGAEDYPGTTPAAVPLQPVPAGDAHPSSRSRSPLGPR